MMALMRFCGFNWRSGCLPMEENVWIDGLGVDLLDRFDQQRGKKNKDLGGLFCLVNELPGFQSETPRK